MVSQLQIFFSDLNRCSEFEQGGPRQLTDISCYFLLFYIVTRLNTWLAHSSTLRDGDTLPGWSDVGSSAPMLTVPCGLPPAFRRKSKCFLYSPPSSQEWAQMVLPYRGVEGIVWKQPILPVSIRTEVTDSVVQGFQKTRGLPFVPENVSASIDTSDCANW